MVVLLDSLIALGGAETLAVDLAIGLDPARYRRTLFITRDQSEIAEREPQRSVLRELAASGVDVRWLHREGARSLRAWLPLLRFLKREKVDVVHAHKFGSNAWAVLWGRLARVAVVVAHEHMWSYTDSSALRRFVDRRVIGPFSDAFIAVSEEGLRQMIDVVGVNPGDVEYVPNGVPLPPEPDRVAARKRLGLNGETPVAGTVALLRPEKQLEVLVEATARLRERHPGARTVIIGEGPERELLERRIAELDLGETVVLAGYRDDVQQVLPAFDVAVCCSKFEGGPLSVMEYMAAALPTVASSVGGLPELLGEGECGVLVPEGDAWALAAAIGELADDPGRRLQMGERARERMRDIYSLPGWVGRIEGVYERCLNAKGVS